MTEGWCGERGPGNSSENIRGKDAIRLGLAGNILLPHVKGICSGTKPEESEQKGSRVIIWTLSLVVSKVRKSDNPLDFWVELNNKFTIELNAVLGYFSVIYN